MLLGKTKVKNKAGNRSRGLEFERSKIDTKLDKIRDLSQSLDN